MFHSLEFIAWSLLVAIAIRSIIAEISLMRLMKTDVNWLLQLSEIVIIIGFAVLSTSLENCRCICSLFYSVCRVSSIELQECCVNPEKDEDRIREKNEDGEDKGYA